MSEGSAFLDLITRVRAGDQAAAAALIADYEPAIRRAIKVQLRDNRLRRQLDSLDICQSVLANFFVRAALGQFDLATPQDLFGLLTTLARNKLATRARHPDVTRRVDYGGAANTTESNLVDGTVSPSEQLAGQDLLEAVRQRLSTDERYLAEQRALDRPWQELADELATNADALRKQLTRALNRVAQELHLNEVDDG
jgi:DNA-directed RNA polymerase specialized sigma24 family protein